MNFDIMDIQTNLSYLKEYQIYVNLQEHIGAFMKSKGYLHVQVPALSPALIPESYLEIFETEFRYFDTKKKLYLIPSPELYLKRLLTKGIGNCYYIGPSFRNSEPNSQLHLPEFTMLEFYKLKTPYLELADEILEMFRYAAQQLYKKDFIQYKKNKVSFQKWEKLTVAEAFMLYSAISEKELFNEKLFRKRAQEKGYTVDNFTYQDIFSQIITQEIEPRLGQNGYPTLLYDYPAAMSSLAKLNDNSITAKRIEFYIDGIEIGGCCEELTDWKEQKKRFEKQEQIRKAMKLTSHEVDKGFIQALQYGLPDCTGAGIGFDRLAMIFTGVDSVDKLRLITFTSS